MEVQEWEILNLQLGSTIYTGKIASRVESLTEEIQFPTFPSKIGDFYMLILKYSIKEKSAKDMLFVMMELARTKNAVINTNSTQIPLLT